MKIRTYDLKEYYLKNIGDLVISNDTIFIYDNKFKKLTKIKQFLSREKAINWINKARKLFKEGIKEIQI